MSDIVTNRKKLGLDKKIKLAGLALKENGPVWFGLFGLYYGASSAAGFFYRQMHDIRRKHQAPGLNSPTLNREIWMNWDWSATGEEWTTSPEWKESLVRNILQKYVAEGGDILEVGPGAGRWTEHLAPRAKTLTGIDISPTCVEICTKRFGSQPGVTFRTTEGSDLPGVGDGTIDTIWSFDVFVHINAAEVEKYLREMHRVLRSGGRGVIHHGAVGGRNGGWRSDVDAEIFRSLAEKAGLTVTEQFSAWTDGATRHQVGLYEDVITVFAKP